MNKHTTDTHSVNTYYKSKHENWGNPNPQPVNDHMLGQILASTPGFKSLVNAMLIYNGKHNHLYMKQETIGETAGLCRQTTNAYLKKMCQMGLVSIKNRGANKSCLYKLSTWFNDPFVRETLAKCLSIFYYAILSTNMLLSGGVTRCNLDLRIININIAGNVSSLTEFYKKESCNVVKIDDKDAILAMLANWGIKAGASQQEGLCGFTPKVVEKAYAKLLRSKDVKNPAALLLWLCKDLSKNLTSVDVTSAPMPKAWSSDAKSAVDIAQEMKAVLDSVVDDVGKRRLIVELLLQDMKLTGENGEEAALMFINAYRANEYTALTSEENVTQSDTMSHLEVFDDETGQYKLTLEKCKLAEELKAACREIDEILNRSDEKPLVTPTVNVVKNNLTMGKFEVDSGIETSPYLGDGDPGNWVEVLD